MKPLFLMLILSGILISCQGEDNVTEKNDNENKFEYIGLKDETNVVEAQENIWKTYGRNYRPSFQVVNDYIYIATYSGIYRKPTNSLKNMEWRKYAFSDLPVIQFVIKGDSIIAITACTDERAFVLSKDGGKTYMAITPPEFLVKKNKSMVVPYSISQNPQNGNSLLASVYPIGVVKSVDFGRSWTIISNKLSGNVNGFANFQPLDTTTIYSTCKSDIDESYIYASYNDGRDWEIIETDNNNNIHHIAFDPTDPNTIIYSANSLLIKTVDKGKLWSPILRDEVTFFKTIYDKIKPQIIYSAGANSQTVTIHHSIDGGDTWFILDQTNILRGGVIDMVQCGNNLILYTFSDGIYTYRIK